MPIEPTTLKQLKEIQQSRSPVFFSATGLDTSFQTRIVAVDPARLCMLNTVPYGMITQCANAGDFQLQARMMRFKSSQITTDGVNLVFPLETVQQIKETRTSERVPFNPDEQAICRILNPHDQKTWLPEQIMDLSATGMSFLTSTVSKLFKPDLQLDRIEIRIGKDTLSRTKGRVVYVRKIIDLKGKKSLQVGVEFSTN
jgi:hypothetical protein